MIGYIFKSAEHGAFAPEGKVEMSDAAIAAHNAALDAETIANLKLNGRGVLYLTTESHASIYSVGTWSGETKIPVTFHRYSWHNIAGKDGRTDVWFNFDGSTWHGVNIGDNQIVRVKRSK